MIATRSVMHIEFQRSRMMATNMAVTNNRAMAAETKPTTNGIIAAIIFWSVAIFLSVVTSAVQNVPGWVWAIRVLTILVGVAVAITLIVRENYQTRHGIPHDRDNTAFDLWTIAHTMAGLVMGAWGVPFPLVAIFTIGWEIFEYVTIGFGDADIFSNRIVDIAV